MFADVNGDNIPRLYTVFNSPERCSIALGNGAGRYGEFTSIAENIEVTNPEHIQVVDFDGDGINDIHGVERCNIGVVFFKGKGNGKFLPGEFLLNLPKDAMFKFGDFKRRRNLDVVYTNPAENLVTFHFISRK